MGNGKWGECDDIQVPGEWLTESAATIDRTDASGWNTATSNDDSMSANWGRATIVDHAIDVEHTKASPLNQAIGVIAWSKNKIADTVSKLCDWNPAIAQDAAFSNHAWVMTKKVDLMQTERLLNVDTSTRPWEIRWDGKPRLYQLPKPSTLVFEFKSATGTIDPLVITVSLADKQPIHSIAPRDALGIQQTTVNEITDQQDTAYWGAGAWFDRSNHLPWGDDSGGEIGELDPPTEPIKPPYLIMNTIEFYAVNGTEQVAVEPTDLSLKLDLDSHAWELTGTIKGQTAKNYILPDADGPKSLSLTINGWSWLFAVKSYKRSKQLVGETYSFTAVSRSQFLTGDWSDDISESVDSDINAWQLVESLLTPLGFTLDRTDVTEWYRTPDWTLQAGSVAWSAAKPLDIITQIATAAGATLQPHRTDDTIIISPRYRLSPWEWATAQDSAFSHLIPEAMIPDGAESGDFQTSTELERVLVGGTTHGAITEVIKRNTAGTVSAADVSDVLNQENTVNAERGRNVLCDSGVIEQLSIQLPLMPPGQAPGLLEPGQLVKIQREDATFTIGMVLSNSIKPDNVASVWQSAVLEVHHVDS